MNVFFLVSCALVCLPGSLGKPSKPVTAIATGVATATTAATSTPTGTPVTGIATGVATTTRAATSTPTAGTPVTAIATGVATTTRAATSTPTAGPNSLDLEASPQEIIPGLTQSLNIRCAPGKLAVQFRQIFLIQLLPGGNDPSTPALATLVPGQAPTKSASSGADTMVVSGHLDSDRPAEASLSLTIPTPGASAAMPFTCKVVGLGTDGGERTRTATVDVTVHPEASDVDVTLKAIVAALKREADAMIVQTNTMQQENQRLTALNAARLKAVAQKQAEVGQLRAEVASLQQTVDLREASLNATADDLGEEIANVTLSAPPMRVAFNAAEKTERTYATGAQVLFETVEMNEGAGYNSSESVFQAPVAGVYFFTSAQLAHDTASASYRAYSIRLNSTVIGSAYNGDDRQSSMFQHSSTGTVVSLTPYDKVTVFQQYSSTATTTLAPYSNTPDGLSTNFAGYLLY